MITMARQPIQRPISQFAFCLQAMNPSWQSKRSTGSVSFNITQTAEYYLELKAFGGPVTYTPSMGTLQSGSVGPVADASLNLDAQAEFVPGEVLIRYRPGETVRLAAADSLARILCTALRGVGTDGLLKLQDAQAAPAFRALAGRVNTAEAGPVRKPLNAIVALRKRPDIAWASPLHPAQKCAVR